MGVVVNEGIRKGKRNMVWQRKEDGRSGGGGRGSGVGRASGAERGNDTQGNYSSRQGNANGIWHGGGRRWEDQKTLPNQVVYFRKKNSHEMSYVAAEDVMEKLRKMFMERLVNPGTGHTVQEWFNMQGIFSIKATPIGANFVLLEEFEECMLVALNTDAADLLWEKFDDIRSWSPSVVDTERVVWVRCHGGPVHAWNNDFFGRLARNFGVMLGVDENTRKKYSLDVARILIRTRGFNVFNAVIHAKINGEMSHIKVLEEWCGPMHWDGLTSPNNDVDDGDSPEMEDGSDEDDGPPLFTAKNDGYVESECEEEDEEKGGVKGVTVVEGTVLEKVEEANHEKEKQKEDNALGLNEDVISSNIAAQEEQVLNEEPKKLMILMILI